jgi:hypothetical protein
VARGRTPFRDRVRDRRYQKIIEAAAAHPAQWAGAVTARPVHVIPVRFPDEETARRHSSLIYSEARYQGYGRKVHKTVHKDGTVTLAFQLFTKAEARAYVAAGRNGQGLAYNTRRPKRKK